MNKLTLKAERDPNVRIRIIMDYFRGSRRGSILDKNK